MLAQMTIHQHRATRRSLILVFFHVQLGRKFRTDWLHVKFGTSFRSRISEMNADPDCPIVIRNERNRLPDGAEESWYWAEERLPLFGAAVKGRR